MLSDCPACRSRWTAIEPRQIKKPGGPLLTDFSDATYSDNSRKLCQKSVVVHYAILGGASVPASRLVSSLAPPNCTITQKFIGM
jgi:hypothetical protein